MKLNETSLITFPHFSFPLINFSRVFFTLKFISVRKIFYFPHLIFSSIISYSVAKFLLLSSDKNS